MPNTPPPPDERPASPPPHQSFWFPVAPESAPEVAHDESDAPAPSLAPPQPVNGLGWKAPRRVHVPVFGRDAAPGNTSLPDAAIEENPVPTGAGRDNPQPQYVREFVLNGVSVDAPAAPRVPTANDETVRQLREHIVPGQDPDLDVVDASFDPDFQEVRRERTAADCAARFQDVVNFAPPDQIPPPKGAQAAQAPADPCGRDDATPNDGVVPQEMEFCCAQWSDGTFTIRPSDGESFVLNKQDARALIRYVTEVLSARARAAA